jgi:hypothetical protein
LEHSVECAVQTDRIPKSKFVDGRLSIRDTEKEILTVGLRVDALNCPVAGNNERPSIARGLVCRYWTRRSQDDQRGDKQPSSIYHCNVNSCDTEKIGHWVVTQPRGRSKCSAWVKAWNRGNRDSGPARHAVYAECRTTVTFGMRLIRLFIPTHYQVIGRNNEKD